MTKESYLKITGLIREDPKKIRLVRSTNQLLTRFVFLLYPIFLFLLLLQKNPHFLRAILVPAISFVAVTVFRKVVNVPRPYEKFDMPPVLEKDTKGKSFPSRHVFNLHNCDEHILYPHRKRHPALHSRNSTCSTSGHRRCP